MPLAPQKIGLSQFTSSIFICLPLFFIPLALYKKQKSVRIMAYTGVPYRIPPPRGSLSLADCTGTDPGILEGGGGGGGSGSPKR